jgi:hypothetical protein
MSDTDNSMVDDVRAAVGQLSADEPASSAELDNRVSPRTVVTEDFIAEVEKSTAQAADVGERVAAKISADEKQSRDARGRFSKAEAEEPPPYDLSELSKSIAAEIHAQGKAKAPTSWSDAAKTEFSLLSPAVQQAVLKREAEIQKGQQQYNEGRSQLDSVEQIMAPRRESYQKFGFKNDAEAINHIFALSDQLERDPSSVAIRVLQSMPPAHLERVRQALGVAPPQQQMDAYAQERIQQALAVAEVQRWEQTAGEHYGLGKDLMRQMLEAGYAKSLDEAYRMAVAQHPAAMSIEKQRHDRARLQSKARAVNASLSGSPHGVSSAVKSNGKGAGSFGDIAEDVRAAMQSLL